MMREDMKIYHVETQEDYDDLMTKLEKQGYRWILGDKPTAKNSWLERQEETVIYLNEHKNYTISRSYINSAKKTFPDINIIKHKAKGVKQMEKVVVPQFVADWFEQNKGGLTIYGLLHLFSDTYYSFDDFRKWVEDYNLKEEDAQEIIAKMYLFQDYEVEEKKYYWRKKKEYCLEFEYQHSSHYINFDTDDSKVFLDNREESNPFLITKFTKSEIIDLVGEEGFKKLERVELYE